MKPAFHFARQKIHAAAARLRGRLVVEHETMTTVDGIARFRVYVNPEYADQGAYLVVRAGSQRGEPIPITTAGGPVGVGVQTRLLPEGKCRLVFELWVADVMVKHAAEDILVHNPGPLAQEVRRSLARNGTSLSFGGDCDATLYPYDDTALTAWFDRPDAHEHIAKLTRQGTLTAADADLLRHFVDHGYMVLERLIDDELLAAANRDIDQAVRDGYQGYRYGSSQRIEHLHHKAPGIQRLWLDARYLRVIDLLFGVRARPCQTLTYVFGSEQDPHQDTVHLTPFPAGYMCGTWIALQDVAPDSGELVIFPGSHREPRLRMQESQCNKVRNGDWSEFGAKLVPQWQQISARYTPHIYRPSRGTVLIWHENLLHGGLPRRNLELERRALVIHNFAEGAIVYYDATGLAGSTVDPTAVRALG